MGKEEQTSYWDKEPREKKSPERGMNLILSRVQRNVMYLN